MQRPGALAHLRPKLATFVFSLQVILALLVVLVSATSLFRLYSGGVFFRADAFRSSGESTVGDEVVSITSRITELQARVKKTIEHPAASSDENWQIQQNVLLSDVLLLLDHVNSYLMDLQLSRVTVGGRDATAAQGVGGAEGDEIDEEEERDTSPLADFFLTEEIRKYLRVKESRYKRKTFFGANISVGAIGHACVGMKVELEEYMDYDVGDLCKDDWPLAQKLMVHGCDPLPRRRCMARAPPLYQKPLPMNESLWAVPDDRNVRWTKYTCRSFECLRNSSRRRGFFKCGDCFKLEEQEARRWVSSSSSSSNTAMQEADFLIEEVLGLKPGEVRIGLDFSIGVGSFAARMREHNVTIVSSTLNVGAPFNEMIALRGLLPLYVSLSQRLPFFDNTLDLIHTTLFFDGWIDLQFLDFVVFDWDRVLRPGGLLWIDRFFCEKKDVDDYLYMFSQLRYKRLKWVVSRKLDKDDRELYFSAVLEKPARPF